MPSRAIAPALEVNTPGLSVSQTENEAVACERARDHLLALQEPDGHWRGLLQTNVSMDAEDLLLREFLGIRDEERARGAAAWIRSQQRADGSWANFDGGPGDLSTTIEAYWGLRVAGDQPGDEHMTRAAAWIRERGGPREARVFTQIWMALFGLWPWDDVPALPPELVLLPSWFPLNPYDFACWARQTIVALTIVRAHRPARPLGFTLEELGPGPPARRAPLTSVSARILAGLDQLGRAYERSPIGPLRRHALRAAERWVIQRQEADGGWGGIQPPWVYSLMALHLQGHATDHPVMRAGLEGLERFTVRREGNTWLEACQSPVWDTALAVLALRDAGLEADHPALVRAVDWLLDMQVTDVAGDWAVARRGTKPGGWPFEYHNVNYPDIDDTAICVLALRRVAHPDPRRVELAASRAVDWMLAMQSHDGGWAAFDADNTQPLTRRMPFCDFGEVIDPPSADVTAHVLEALAAVRGEATRDSAASGMAWLDDAQEWDGSWFGRWGVNHIYGTWSALCALQAAGVGADDPRVRRAVAWLKRKQNDDGGWGEDCRSYRDPAWVGRGESTASQTAWALIALQSAGEAGSQAVRRGMDWLCSRQLPVGTWDEPQYTGTGFPGVFYINYHLYRLIFPVMALGRCLQDTRAA
ncbi:MAG TPA: squalene--hopene cyclase [Solirubrobacteraceae bacterium]|jgi:squalene-hopene/tetraprenyl-beta-curcumene cyclase